MQLRDSGSALLTGAENRTPAAALKTQSHRHNNFIQDVATGSSDAVTATPEDGAERARRLDQVGHPVPMGGRSW